MNFSDPVGARSRNGCFMSCQKLSKADETAILPYTMFAVDAANISFSAEVLDGWPVGFASW